MKENKENKELKPEDIEQVNGGGNYEIPEEDRDYYLEKRQPASCQGSV